MYHYNNNNNNNTCIYIIDATTKVVPGLQPNGTDTMVLNPAKRPCEAVDAGRDNQHKRPKTSGGDVSTALRQGTKRPHKEVDAGQNGQGGQGGQQRQRTDDGVGGNKILVSTAEGKEMVTVTKEQYDLWLALIEVLKILKKLQKFFGGTWGGVWQIIKSLPQLFFNQQYLPPCAFWQLSAMVADLLHANSVNITDDVCALFCAVVGYSCIDLVWNKTGAHDRMDRLCEYIWGKLGCESAPDPTPDPALSHDELLELYKELQNTHDELQNAHDELLELYKELQHKHKLQSHSFQTYARTVKEPGANLT